MKMNQYCPRCKGERYVFDSSSLVLTIVFPIVWFVETCMGDYEERTITRKPCPVCNNKDKE
jgi:hypothetical protein